MDVATILIATLAATSLMTAFSYLISEGFRKLYKEPVLLEYLIARWHLGLSGAGKTIVAWIIHYIIGLIFVLVYYFLWKHNLYELTWLSGLFFGIIIGFVGIAGWEIMFALTKYEPTIDFKGYYLQLFFAHVIFGITTFIVFRILLQ